MGSQILVTGFAPFSPLTHLRGNPSETVARRLGELHGHAAQVANCVLELEGASTRFGGLMTEERLRSSFATAVGERCRSIGMKLGTAPSAPLVYWCLRSYAEALRWAESRGVPCAFVHLNSMPPLGDVDSQVGMASELLAMMAGRARP